MSLQESCQEMTRFLLDRVVLEQSAKLRIKLGNNSMLVATEIVAYMGIFVPKLQKMRPIIHLCMSVLKVLDA